MRKLDKLSVFISLVLRHKPEAAEINLDEHGWANVDELIDGINSTGRKIDMETLEEFLYHGTADRFIKNIMIEGLKPMSRLYVHLSKDIKTANKVGKRHGKPVILKIHSGWMYQEGIKFYLSENGVWLTRKVDVKYLEQMNV